MNIEAQIQKINELVKKGNKASFKLVLDKAINLQKIKPNSSKLTALSSKDQIKMMIIAILKMHTN